MEVGHHSPNRSNIFDFVNRSSQMQKITAPADNGRLQSYIVPHNSGNGRPEIGCLPFNDFAGTLHEYYRCKPAN